MEHCQIAISKIFDHIRYNKLPIKFVISDDYIEVDCRGWDINEIDTFIMLTHGSRNEFTVKVRLGPHGNNIDIHML
jgi:hypothetical protein